MELDEIDPGVWELLEAATDEYIEQQDSRLDAAASALIEDITVSRPYSITRERLGELCLSDRGQSCAIRAACAFVFSLIVSRC